MTRDLARLNCRAPCQSNCELPITSCPASNLNAPVQEGKASPKGRGTAGSSIHHASSLAEGVRNTLRRNGGSHPDLVRTGSEAAQPATEPAETAAKVRTT